MKYSRNDLWRFSSPKSPPINSQRPAKPRVDPRGKQGPLVPQPRRKPHDNFRGARAHYWAWTRSLEHFFDIRLSIPAPFFLQKKNSDNKRQNQLEHAHTPRSPQVQCWERQGRVYLPTLYKGGSGGNWCSIYFVAWCLGNFLKQKGACMKNRIPKNALLAFL